MRIRMLIAANIASVFVSAVSVQAGEQIMRFDSRSGSKVRIEGTSSVHDWQMVGKMIGGFIEVGPTFPTDPGQTMPPGKVDAKGEIFIPVRTFQSQHKDGKPYSTAMDDRMYQAMKADTNPRARILYMLNELSLKEMPKSKDAPYVYDSKGDLVVAGVTNKISMPVNVMPLGDKKLKISGSTTLKMTSFKIDPPSPKLALGLIKTGDDVKVIFEWMVAKGE